MADGIDTIEITDATKRFFEQEFKKLDDGDGYLTSDELADCLELFGLSFEDEQIDQIRQMFAARGKGHRLRIQDVLNKLPEVVKHSMSGDEMLKAFQVFDKDNDGYIRLPEMKKILCSGPNGMAGDDAARVITTLMKFDTNHDGKFDYTEFINIYTSDEYQLIQSKAEADPAELDAEEEGVPAASSNYASLYTRKYNKKSPAKTAPKSARSPTKRSPPTPIKSAKAGARQVPQKPTSAKPGGRQSLQIPNSPKIGVQKPTSAKPGGGQSISSTLGTRQSTQKPTLAKPGVEQSISSPSIARKSTQKPTSARPTQQSISKPTSPYKQSVLPKDSVTKPASSSKLTIPKSASTSRLSATRSASQSRGKSARLKDPREK